MSWHCRSWAQNLVGNYATATFDDGDDCDQIYSEARCSTFSRSGSFTSDEHDNPIDSELDTGSDAWCIEHNRDADWEAHFSTADDLRAAGFFVCEDDDETYHYLDTFNDHRVDEHGFDEPNDISDEDFHAQHATHSIKTSHASWRAPITV